MTTWKVKDSHKKLIIYKTVWYYPRVNLYIGTLLCFIYMITFWKENISGKIKKCQTIIFLNHVW